jgi:hypothetical protein
VALAVAKYSMTSALCQCAMPRNLGKTALPAKIVSFSIVHIVKRPTTMRHISVVPRRQRECERPATTAWIKTEVERDGTIAVQACIIRPRGSSMPDRLSALAAISENVTRSILSRQTGTLQTKAKRFGWSDALARSTLAKSQGLDGGPPRLPIAPLCEI